MNSKSMTTLKKKHEAFKRYMQTKDAEDYQQFAKFRNQTKWEIRKAKREYERQVAKQTKANPRAFFQYVNSKLSTRAGIADLEKEDGTTTETDQEKAEVLNNFFASVFTKEDMSSMPSFREGEQVDILEEIEITENQILKKNCKS